MTTPILDSILRENSQRFQEIIEGSQVWKNLLEISHVIQQVKQTRDINVLSDYLEGTSAKPAKKKEILQSTENRENIIPEVKIKIEKESSAEAINNINVKIEPIDEEYMPAPNKLPPRKKKVSQDPAELPKRSTRTRKKAQNADEPTNAEKPDLKQEDKHVPNIELNATAQDNKRATRARTKKNANNCTFTITETTKLQNETINKRDRSMEDELQVQLKKSRSDSSSTADNNSGQTVYEDAVSIVEATEDQNKSPDTVDPNSTYMVTKPSENLKNIPELVVEKSAVKPTIKQTSNSQIKTPLEKKGQTPVRSQSASRMKTLYNSAKGSRQIPVRCNTPSSSLRSNSALTNSALKASQAEYREREKRRLQKEQAQKKKEALLQAASEEKKRIREEKQLKAHLQREQMEKEKQKQLEELRARELQKRQKLAEAKLLPIYMTTKMPRLPLEDYFDSDDESAPQKCTRPAWTADRNMVRQQRVMEVIGESLKNTFFFRKIHTPDLLELFECIDSKKLQRSSSAVWRKPPRYTLFSMTRIIYENDIADD